MLVTLRPQSFGKILPSTVEVSASPATKRRISPQNFEVCNTSNFWREENAKSSWRVFFRHVGAPPHFREVLPGWFGTNEKSVNVIRLARWAEEENRSNEASFDRDFGEIKFGSFQPSQAEVKTEQESPELERKAGWGSFLVKRCERVCGWSWTLPLPLHHRRLLQAEGPKVGESEDWRWLMGKDFRSSWPTWISFPFFKFSSPWAVAGLRRSWTDIPPSYLKHLGQVKELSLRP